ncbi:hypothetical protein GCM10020000_33710 [Streptomyces olivoverticillatus]
MHTRHCGDVGLSGYDPNIVYPGYDALMETVRAGECDAVVIFQLSHRHFGTVGAQVPHPLAPRLPAVAGAGAFGVSTSLAHRPLDAARVDGEPHRRL